MFKYKNTVLISVVLPLYGLWLVGQGAYIHAKAILAQRLLEAAWVETLSGDKEVKPWPWADTWPVIRLSVPRLGISRIVLAGANGSSLAFGPGHLFNSAQPGDGGNIVIAGHRDTHFRFIRELMIGETIALQPMNGQTIRYRVTDIQIVHENDAAVIDKEIEETLTLITCYPFDAIEPGGPLRYVVVGKSINTDNQGSI